MEDRAGFSFYWRKMIILFEPGDYFSRLKSAIIKVKKLTPLDRINFF